MKVLKVIYTAIYCVTFFTVDAQNLTAYHNYRDYFYVFDNGSTKELEYLPVKSYQIGGNAIAYIDNTFNFKVYNKGIVTKLDCVPGIKYFATDHLIAYIVAKQLNVFDNGRVKMLSNWVNYFAVGDSLIAFFDQYSQSFNIYYKGRIIVLEDVMSKSSVKEFKTGDNTLAYVNYNDNFKIFYRGKTTTIMLIDEPITYQVGKNIVAYINESTLTFNVFYKGELYELESFQPNSFKTGDDMVVYLDNTNSLKVFYDNRKITVLTYEPEFYKVIDSIMVYSDQSFFNVFYDGKKYVLENFIPDNYQMDYNSVAWLDQQGALKVFCKGEIQTLTDFEQLNNYKLTRNTIWYNMDVNTNKVFNNGTIY